MQTIKCVTIVLVSRIIDYEMLLLFNSKTVDIVKRKYNRT